MIELAFQSMRHKLVKQYVIAKIENQLTLRPVETISTFVQHAFNTLLNQMLGAFEQWRPTLLKA